MTIGQLKDPDDATIAPGYWNSPGPQYHRFPSFGSLTPTGSMIYENKEYSQLGFMYVPSTAELIFVMDPLPYVLTSQRWGSDWLSDAHWQYDPFIGTGMDDIMFADRRIRQDPGWEEGDRIAVAIAFLKPSFLDLNLGDYIG